MTEDVLDLDAPPAPDPTGRLGGWSRGRTAVVAVAVAMALALGLGVVLLLRSPPPPAPQVLGLQDGPVEAWRWGDDGRAYGGFVPVSGDRLLVSVGGGDPAPPQVALLAAGSGEELWRTSVQGVWGFDESHLTDLPGTPWVGVPLRGATALLDRETGREMHRLEMPVFDSTEYTDSAGNVFESPGGYSWVSSSNNGTLFLAVRQNDEDPYGPGAARLMAYDPGDLVHPLWDVDVDAGGGWSGGFARQVLESDGFAYLAPDSAASEFAAYRYVFRMSDGAQPDWQPTRPSMHVVDGVTVINEFGAVRAIEPASGEEVWRSEVGNWGTVVDDGLLYLLPLSGKGELQRLDPRTGKVRWVTPLANQLWGDPQGAAPGALWGDDLIVLEGAYGSAAMAVLRFDATTGREVMRTPIEARAGEAAVYVGEGQLVVLITPSDPQTGETTQPKALGIDPDTGEVRWERTLHGYATVYGGRLVVGDDDSVAVYR
ncbi:PQQ-binding-like beta-propeller repeat protein [Tessaracoccus sp. MC1865]|uniref:outer membrane protein assembly factor BamB family protein n=1 Tax=Tessaracoccus sp. MC1865 TaxID=2760310 RepID=UPI0016003F95|nr:PQQ-binding-like beta-propeller repeat protein [Tessaracoccus sp. MC1865]MBB1483199.1 PQQ-binding-like beta-propeller repeat protein [Tessaracoccus sp. MC1865]QTO37383.1 PQQ-binding-like beta-propeller repeat protein [Tessaracoccus sp. MC1865]